MSFMKAFDDYENLCHLTQFFQLLEFLSIQFSKESKNVFKVFLA